MPRIPGYVLSVLLLLVPIGARCGCDTTCGLSDYNRELWREYLLNHNTALMEAASVDDFFGLSPAGIGPQSLSGEILAGFDLTAAEVYSQRIDVHGETAVVAGKIGAEGKVGGRPAPDFGFLSVFRLIDGEWRLVAASLVPQAGGVLP